MSTQVIETSLEVMKEDLVEYINDENLDILDEVSAEEFAGQVIKIAQRLTFFMTYQPQKTIHGVIGNIENGVIWNVYVYNMKGGWVSVSDDESTGVSRTLYYPFYCSDDEEGWFAGLTSLASMINEAWYQL